MISGLVASIIRFNSFFHGNAIADGTWTVELPIWTMVEPNIYLLAACLVTYHPLLNEFRIITGRIQRSALSRSGKSSSTANPSQQIASAGETTDKRVFRGRRKMGKNDLESLGNTFDMNDTVDMGDGESLETGDDIRLVRLRQNNLENAKEAIGTQTGLGSNQIQVRSDFYVRSE
jgi:hypothetical protein